MSIGFIWLRVGPVAGSCEDCNEHLAFIKVSSPDDRLSASQRLSSLELKLSVGLTTYNTMKTYGGVEV